MAGTDSIQAGKLRHRIHIDRPTGTCKPTIGKAGAEIGWSLLFENVPASCEPVKATDMIRGGQDVTQVIVIVTIRFMVGVKPNMRIRWKQGNYIIQGIVNEEERNRKLIMTCLALGNQS